MPWHKNSSNLKTKKAFGSQEGDIWKIQIWDFFIFTLVSRPQLGQAWKRGELEKPRR